MGLPPADGISSQLWSDFSNGWSFLRRIFVRGRLGSFAGAPGSFADLFPAIGTGAASAPLTYGIYRSPAIRAEPERERANERIVVLGEFPSTRNNSTVATTRGVPSDRTPTVRTERGGYPGHCVPFFDGTMALRYCLMPSTVTVPERRGVCDYRRLVRVLNP